MDSNCSLVKLYNESHSLVRHHLDSFNHFVEVEMGKIVKTHGRIDIPSSKYFVQFSNIKVEKPTIFESHVKIPLYPHQCRLRNLTYAADITVDIQFPGPGNKLIKTEKFIIGRLPIMLKSKLCNLYGMPKEKLTDKGECIYDTGGYFITKGTERVFLMQEQMAKNRMIIESKKNTKKGGIKLPLSEKLPDNDIMCHVTSYTVINKTKTTVFKNSGYFYVQNSLFYESIPLFVLFAAFNMPAHRDIFESVGIEAELHNELICSVKESIGLGIFSQKQALFWLIPRIKVALNKDNKMTTTPSSMEEEERSLLMARQEINRRVLNHVEGSADNMVNRAKYLGLMVRRILLAGSGRVAEDDRDFYGIKRLEMVGTYLSLMFEDKFQSMVSCLQLELTKTINANKTTQLDPCQYIKQAFITEGMLQCVFTGNWHLQRFSMSRSGVTQVLNRLSYIATLGHLGRISSQFEKVRKISSARVIHLSQYGFVCVADTPEGEACGLVKNLSFLVEITVNLPPEQQRDLESFIRDNYDDGLSSFTHATGRFLIMVNGVPIGWTRTPRELGRFLRRKRRECVFHPHVSIYYEEETSTLHVCSDGGRMVRPYVIVEDGSSSSRFTADVQRRVARGEAQWADLIREGVVEYVDALEGYAECLVAMDAAHATQEHTHIDIDPATALGTVASLIPFPHHNQSPRNTYQCAMGKQALGVISTNQRLRPDGTQHVLISPQRPLTISQVGTLINYHELPAGQNAIVAITCFGGYDIEDALIVNEASLQRGLFRSLTNKCFTESIKENEHLGVSTKEDKRAHAIEADGLARIGAFVRNGDFVIHKITTPVRDPIATSANDRRAEKKSSTTSYQGNETTQCTQVMFTFDSHHHLVRVKTSQNRQPEVGDKLSSRHGQKGVIGRVVPLADMPFSENGLVPDIIMNPHGFPSRMTVGKLIELLANKSAVMDGQIRNCSAFSEAGHKNIDDDYPSVMRTNGFSMSGKELLMSGKNGRVMEYDVYMGPVFYQRLKHMVQDKVHARDLGKNQPLTRQPVVGRSNDGGLRVGEMERDCLIGYGASQILKERMLLSSDPFRAWVCEQCGLLATSKEWCQMCRSSQHISSVVMPYATKLLMQELMTMQITPKLTLSRHETATL